MSEYDFWADMANAGMILVDIYTDGWTYVMTGDPGSWPLALVYVVMHMPFALIPFAILGSIIENMEGSTAPSIDTLIAERNAKEVKYERFIKRQKALQDADWRREINGGGWGRR